MTKIQLSAAEMLLVQDSSWILTKHRIIEKVYVLFGNLATQMQARLQQYPATLPTEVLQSPPKISKGEQYESLPYVVLDYPRFFSKEHVYAIRCFFWWGNYFSITLHLKGIYKQLLRQKIYTALVADALSQYYISVDGNEFNFDLSSKNYYHEDDGLYQMDTNKDGVFLKLSLKVNFTEWEIAEQKLMQAFEHFIAFT